MNKDMKECVMKRCENALMENKKYMGMENEEIDKDILQAEAECLCYLKGVRDAFMILLKL